MNRHDYIKVLETNLLPLIDHDFNGRGYSFQDDNAPVYTAKDVQEWLKTNKIKLLENQPSQSPDLNPIEYLWHELETRIRNRPNNIRNLKELEAALKEECDKIPQNVLINLIESMPRRIQARIENKGWPTKYQKQNQQ